MPTRRPQSDPFDLSTLLREELDRHATRLRDGQQADYLVMLKHIAREVRASVTPWAQLVMGLTLRVQELERDAGLRSPIESPASPRRGKKARHADLVRGLVNTYVSHTVKTRDGMAKAKARGKHVGRPRRAVDLAKARALVAKGSSKAAVAKELGVSEATLRRALRQS